MNATGRLPVPLSIAAIVIAVIGTTRAVEAAAPPRVKSALFATEAGTVNGIRASRKPRAGRLLALGADARYPRSVIPPAVGQDGPQGSQGSPGPTGPAGRPGGDTLLARTFEGRAYPANFERHTVLELTDVPAGSWLVLGSAGSGTPFAGPFTFSCHVTRGSVDLASSSAASGRGTGGGRLTDHLAIAGLTQESPSTLRLRCAHTGETQAIAEHATLAAVGVGRLEIRRADP